MAITVSTEFRIIDIPDSMLLTKITRRIKEKRISRARFRETIRLRLFSSCRHRDTLFSSIFPHISHVWIRLPPLIEVSSRSFFSVNGKHEQTD